MAFRFKRQDEGQAEDADQKIGETEIDRDRLHGEARVGDEKQCAGRGRKVLLPGAPDQQRDHGGAGRAHDHAEQLDAFRAFAGQQHGQVVDLPRHRAAEAEMAQQPFITQFQPGPEVGPVIPIDAQFPAENAVAQEREDQQQQGQAPEGERQFS